MGAGLSGKHRYLMPPPDHADQNSQSRRACVRWREDSELVAEMGTLPLSGSLELGRVGEAVVKGMNIEKRFLGKS